MQQDKAAKPTHLGVPAPSVPPAWRLIFLAGCQMARTSNRQDARPSFQFYPGDWKRDDNLKLCSLAARGLWMEALCIMFFSERRGYLQVKGKALTSKQLAKLIGDEEVNVTQLMAELEAAGVPSRDENGVIYSRRMARDAHIHQVRVEAGKAGGSKQKGSKSEAKHKQTGEEEDEGEVEHEVSTLIRSQPPAGSNLHDWTITFGRWWGALKHVSAKPGYLGVLDPFFTTERRFEFAKFKIETDDLGRYHGLLKPWQLRDMLWDDLKGYREHQAEGAKAYRAWQGKAGKLVEDVAAAIGERTAEATADRTKK